MARDKIYSQEDFRRYRDGEMPFSEQYSLEKQMMEDPFLAEAYEGFISLNEANIKYPESVVEIQRRLETRISGKTENFIPLWAYSAAAGFLILLGVGWLIYVNNQNSSAGTKPVISAVESGNAKKEDTATISAPLIATETNNIVKSPVIEDKPNKPDREIDFAKNGGNSERINLKNDEALAIADHRFEPAAAPRMVPAQSAVSQRIADQLVKGTLVDENDSAIAGATILTSDNSNTQTNEKGDFVINSKIGDSLALGFVGYKRKKIKAGKSDVGTIKLEPDHLTLNEVVVAGYGTQMKQSDSVSGQEARYGQPEPVKGWTHYQEYLDRFKHSSSMQGVVKVSFTVKGAGFLSDFRTEGTKELFDEAVRLVKTGPELKPFKSNGLETGPRAEITVYFGRE